MPNAGSTTMWENVSSANRLSQVAVAFAPSTSYINTFVNTISPYNVTVSPLNITATGDSDLDNVTLYYR